MARIRTLKPEFPQSESMGRVSRDARLAFVQMWTLADDEGRLRGNSRMLASLLFPYDDDAPSLIDGWLSELQTEGCIVRYLADGQSYIEICKWLIHQKIDKPSKSKIPPFDHSSRILANARESSSEDQGSRIKDQGKEGIEKPMSDSPTGLLPENIDEPSEEKSAARVVFEYWQKVMGHSHARLDRKRRAAINGRLKDGYTPEHLCKAIDGCKVSPYHMGKNESGKVYDDIELICRDGPHVDSFVKQLEKGAATPKKMSVAQQLAVRAAERNKGQSDGFIDIN